MSTGKFLGAVARAHASTRAPARLSWRTAAAPPASQPFQADLCANTDREDPCSQVDAQGRITQGTTPVGSLVELPEKTHASLTPGEFQKVLGYVLTTDLDLTSAPRWQSGSTRSSNDTWQDRDARQALVWCERAG